MAEEMNPAKSGIQEGNEVLPKPYDEFEVGEHKIPWFLWLFFILIVSWASIAWIPLTGY